MEGPKKMLKSNEGTLKYEIYENTENLPHNEQNLAITNDLHVYEETKTINNNEDHFRENVEKTNTQWNSFHRVLKDLGTKFSDCGEPFQSQHINIDFTPIRGVDDNALLQQKCIDFWKFVNEHPELKSYETEKVNHVSTNEIIIDDSSVDQGYSQEIEIPAVEILQRPDIPQKALATKQKYTICEHLDKEYSLVEAKVEQRQLKLKKRSTLNGPQSYLGLKSKSSIRNKSSVVKYLASDDVNKLCSEMDQWDLSHPKSMEPPKRVPSVNSLK